MTQLVEHRAFDSVGLPRTDAVTQSVEHRVFDSVGQLLRTETL